MKKYEVVKDYVDKYTLEYQHKGAIVELTDKRASDLHAYVKKVKEAKKKDD